MRKRALRVLLIGSILLTVLSPLPLFGSRTAQAAARPAYAVNDLGVLPGFDRSVATGLNAANQVSGYSGCDLYLNECSSHGSIAARGTLTDIGAISSTYDDEVKAIAIDARGQVIALQPQTNGYAFLYADAARTTLPLYGFIEGFSDSGLVVGWLPSGRGIGAWSYQLGAPYYQPLPNGGRPITRAFAANARGQIVGEGGIYPNYHGLLWENGSLTDLGTLTGGNTSSAYAINAAGDIAGSATQGDTGNHLVIWHDGTIRDLGVGDVRPYAINASGQIVGGSLSTDAHPVAPRAFIWRDGARFDLNDLIPAGTGWTLEEARAINDTGYIAGFGMHDGAEHAFLLRPTFADVSTDNPYHDALLGLADWGILRGDGSGQLRPDELVLRAQSAALIARTEGWEFAQPAGNAFPDQGVVDDALWRNVRALADRGVALGYQDGTYNPTGPVLHQQVALFIARARIAAGAWVEQPDTAPYPNLPNGTPQEQADRRMVATYIHYAGAIAGRPVGQNWSDWDQPATRGWFAQLLWQALQSGASPH